MILENQHISSLMWLGARNAGFYAEAALGFERRPFPSFAQLGPAAIAAPTQWVLTASLHATGAWAG
jgi:hypothetical protein